jgi:hypothetical protein
MIILKTRRQGGNEKKTAGLKLLVLVPHRDARLPLRAWSAALFSAGCEGAFSFPWLVPLAALARPLNAEELKHCAAVLREASLAGGKGGKISCRAAASLAFPPDSFNTETAEKIAFFGPLLELGIPDATFTAGAAEKILYRFPQLIIGSCIMRGENPPRGGIPPVPALSFRAAAIANMSYRPLRIKETRNTEADCIAPDSGYSFEWRIGRLCWLPPVKKRG